MLCSFYIVLSDFCCYWGRIDSIFCYYCCCIWFVSSCAVLSISFIEKLFCICVFRFSFRVSYAEIHDNVLHTASERCSESCIFLLFFLLCPRCARITFGERGNEHQIKYNQLLQWLSYVCFGKVRFTWEREKKQRKNTLTLVLFLLMVDVVSWVNKWFVIPPSFIV